MEPTWILIPYDTSGPIGLVPIVGRNWTVRASLEARARVRKLLRKPGLDALFLHTQVTSLFAGGLMAQLPSVVSLDATPINFDRFGEPYGHQPSRFTLIESAKNALMRRNFVRARRLIVWHNAGRHSLINDYRVPQERIAVIPPGIDLEAWSFSRRAADDGGPVRLLFVGGDFRRKGGATLLAAFRNGLMQECDLDIVTRESVDTEGLTNVRVHYGLRPNAPDLLALYARADIFIFPTLADMLPLAIMEAFAAGLPVIGTNVGYLTEQIEDGVTGYLVAPGDAGALAEAALRLVRDPGLRRRMGAAARRTAEERFNGAVNYPRVLEICKACARHAQHPDSTH